MMPGSAVVHAVVVTFYPDSDHLTSLIARLLEEVNLVHIVDNTPERAYGAREAVGIRAHSDRVSLWEFGENLGVAAGFNRGINLALEAGAAYVLLSDQDSLPGTGMVPRLLSTLRQQELQGKKVAVVGPDFVNNVDERSFRFDDAAGQVLLYRKVRPSVDTPVIEVASVISSGSLIPISSLKAIGHMREDLFVDYVDMEWCERARREGFVCLADGAALMHHEMGEDRLEFWLLRRRTVARYGLLRLRYQARNSTYLATRPGVVWSFRVGVAWTLLGKFYAYLVTFDRRGKSLIALMHGISMGLIGKLGKL